MNVIQDKYKKAENYGKIDTKNHQDNGRQNTCGKANYCFNSQVLLDLSIDFLDNIDNL